MDCVFDPRLERFECSDACLQISVHHPRKGGSTNSFGELSVSPFRLRFTQSIDTKLPVTVYKDDYLLPYDIPISCIHRVLFSHKRKKSKEINSTTELSRNPEDLDYNHIDIYCSDFSILKFETITDDKVFAPHLLKPILDFGARRDPNTLFGVTIGNRVYNDLQKVNPNRGSAADNAWLFQTLSHPPNHAKVFPEDPSFPLKVEPPFGWKLAGMPDEKLADFGKEDIFQEKRVPIVSCIYEDSGVLLRCGKVSKSKRNNVIRKLSEFCTASGLTSGGANLTAVHLIKLNHRQLPRIEEIHQSRKRLRELCQEYDPDAVNTNWLDALDSCQWLAHLSRALSLASMIAERLRRHSAWILLAESRGSDWTCVICSLVNIILFPKFRKRAAFEELIVREWTVSRHAFTTRQELASYGIADNRAGPMFPFFLDCVQQLWNQFPSAFDFTPELLALLHDFSHAGMFREFLYHLDNPVATLAPSVFDYKRLLSADVLVLLENPIHQLANLMHAMEKEKDDTKKKEKWEMEWLFPDCDVRHMRLWREHYMRALPFMDTDQSGRAAELWRYRELLAALKTHLSKTSNGDGSEGHECVPMRKKNAEFRLPSGLTFSNVTAFFPLSREDLAINVNRDVPARPFSVFSL